MGNKQTCCFRKLLHWCHSHCCVLSEGCATKAVIAFAVLGGIGRASPVMTGWGFAVVSLEAVSTCIVKCGKCMRPCVVSMTTLLFPKKCNSNFGPIIFLITTNCSANMLSPIAKIGVFVATRFSNWPFATCFLKIGRVVDFQKITRDFLFSCVQLILGNCTVHWHSLLSLPRHLLLGYSRNPEARRAFNRRG